MKKSDLLKQKSDIFIALDFPGKEQAFRFLEQIDASQAHLKVGLEMFTRLGPDFISLLNDRGYDIFLDLKCYDIPNTVAQTMKSIAEMGVAMTTLHAMGGMRMMQAAKDAIKDYPVEKQPLLLAVTVLTSFEESEIKQLYGSDVNLNDLTLHLAQLAKEAGMDGIVCSPFEADKIRELCGSDFLIVTPGIRPADQTSADDQRRIATPKQARENGASFLVIGRPITQSADPGLALQQMC